MLRIGHNPNTNMLPMFHFLEWNNPLLERVTAEPSGHNRLLAAGELDLAPISSFAYGEHWQEYAVLPHLSVSNKGRVGSILLFSKVPLKDLEGKTVALTDLSATSVHLAKILLQRFYGVFPHYLTLPSNLEEMLKLADAALLIGDPAIQAEQSRPECHIYDLGEEWRRFTGHAMTFAVWAFPQALIRDQAEELRAVHRLLLAAKMKARSHWEAIYEACVEMLGTDRVFWQDYFSRFSYDLDPDSVAGLEHYFDLCYELGFFPSRPRLNFWS